MTCWEVLGINPTNNPDSIQKAYEAQRKFASGDMLSDLDEARDEAMRQAGVDVPVQETRTVSAGTSEPEPNRSSGGPMNARDQQVVREVVIQVDAMLNDSYRRSDANVWRAILTEPPADRDHIREAISDELYPRIKPHLDAGDLPEPVIAFLAQWLGWTELEQALEKESAPSNDPFDDPARRGASSAAQNGPDTSPKEKRQPMPNFWPAVIGWVAGLIILTSVFSNLLGS